MVNARDIALQPKQYELLDKILKDAAKVLGAGGGRGAAKSSAIDRISLALMMLCPGQVSTIVMRTYAQVRKYHIEPLFRAYPELEEYYTKSEGKLKIPCGDGKFSELHIGYAENYAAVENFFRSANYKYIFIDQAEQFQEHELKEIRKACRWPGGGAKLILSHNMGGIGIGCLRKIFHTHEYNERDDPKNYAFIKFNPWDNCFWVQDALREDGLTEKDYYSWTDQQRQDYAAARGEYTRQLNSEDDAIRARDWFGSWDSLEGAYFGRVLDSQHTIVDATIVGQLKKPWWPMWMSGDWGSGHYTAYYWHTRGIVDPGEAKRYLGLIVDRPVSVMITYREWIGQELSEAEVASTLVELSTNQERGLEKYNPLSGMPEHIGALYFSPDAFELSIRRSGQNTIADEIGKVLRIGGLPYPSKANNARVPGWRAMYGLLSNTKKAFAGEHVSTIWLIADNCPELIKAIPLLMRDPKNLEDVLKTDKTSVDIGQDAADGCRYGVLCREASDNTEPVEASNARILSGLPDDNARMLRSLTLPRPGLGRGRMR